MIKPCVRCKNQREGGELKDVRNNEEVEGYIISHFPEVLQLPENEPIEVCVDCLREVNNLQSIRNTSQSRPKNQAEPRETQDVPIISESLESVAAGPLSSSVERVVAISDSFDLDKLKNRGELRKLIPKNRNMRKNVRELLEKPMPVAAKKRKLNEMLGNAANVSGENGGETSSSNSQSETVIERRNYAQEMYQDLLNRSDKIIRTYRSDSSIHSSQSHSTSPNGTQSFSESIVPNMYNVSSQEPISLSGELTQIPPSPVLTARTRTEVILYQDDSSSDSDRISRRRISERLASRSQSVASNQSAASEQSARERSDTPIIPQRRNDGNDHSNLAAPRRINTEINIPTSTRPQNTMKTTNGG